MTIKSLLLTDNRVIKEVSLFGSKTTVRAVPVAVQVDYIALVTNENKTEQEKALAAAELVLGALCKPDGTAYPDGDLPTAEELLASRSNAELIDAVNTLHRMSNGSLEEAEKN
ncbi:hypothetical protein [Plesiomonas shigelloides]|uniref:hypothetical protein n=1 Tax=Plesiomonas shigelloides TaxID=703 RepID=UPI000A10161F|nr:hypothetical protein [Plesiomonas shigelloides]